MQIRKHVSPDRVAVLMPSDEGLDEWHMRLWIDTALRNIANNIFVTMPHWEAEDLVPTLGGGKWSSEDRELLSRFILLFVSLMF